MKTVIVYASRHGATEHLANQIAIGLTTKPDLINLQKTKNPDISEYDFVIVGGSIYVGQILDSVKQFCKINQTLLLRKKLALFISCMEDDKSMEFITTAFPQPLREHAMCMGSLGGFVQYKKLFWWEKLMLKAVKQAAVDSRNDQSDKLNDFIKCCNQINSN